MSRLRSRSSVGRPEALRDQVARSVRTDIAAGRLRHGQRLPSTRELAEQFAVSVYTVNAAMEQLAAEGLVLNKARSGRVVNAPAEQVSSPRGQSMPQQVVLIGGYAGSGKSELGRILARATGWAMLDKDTLTRFVVEAALEMGGLSRNDRESSDYLTQIRPHEYECLMAAAIENLQCGNSVIVTAPFVREFSDDEWLRRCTADMAQLDATVSLVWIRSDADTMQTYIRRRGAGRDAVKLADWSGYISGVNTEFVPAAPHTVIENSLSSESLDGQARLLVDSLLARS